MSDLRPDQLDHNKLRQTMVLHTAEEPASSPAETLAQKMPTFQALGTARVDEFAAIRVGGKVDGFEVVENLAEGGMGAVFRVKDRETERQLALKAPLPDGRGGSFNHRLRRFLREVRLTSRMNHPGVAKVVEVGQEDGLPYFTMELVDGTPLSDKIYEGSLDMDEACSIIEQAARGVHHIHEKGVIHRDLKPQNILVKRDGSVVIIDFGLARDAAGIDPRITQSGVWLGTPAYISPEQAQGEASTVDARADVYSLAAVLYEALTGAPPYGSGNTRQIFKNLKTKVAENVRYHRPECPEAVEKVVMKALSKCRDGRYATALEFADALAQARKSIGAVTGLKVASDATPLADLDALESTPAPNAPILRAPSLKKPSGQKGDSTRIRKGSGRLQAETLRDSGRLAPVSGVNGWKDLGTSDANAKALPAEAPKAPRGTSTERRMRSAEGRRRSKRMQKLAQESAELRKRFLILAGPAVLAMCGLLLLVLP